MSFLITINTHKKKYSKQEPLPPGVNGSIMNLKTLTVQQELQNLGYKDIKQDGTARFPVITAHRNNGVYDIDVRIECSPKPNTVIRGRNGCSMKYVIEDEQSVERTFKALKALNEGKAFYQIWPLLSH